MPDEAGTEQTQTDPPETEVAEWQYFFYVFTPHHTAKHALMRLWATTVEFILEKQNVGTFDRKKLRAWLDDPDDAPIRTGSTQLGKTNSTELNISIGYDIRQSPLPSAASAQLRELI